MSWNLSKDRPIYLQLVEQIKLQILSGTYASGEHFPSVRELATEAAVNPNTMQKALSELERSGLVYTQRTSGRYITEDTGLIQEVRLKLAEEQIRSFLFKMEKLGYESSEALSIARKITEEETT